MDNLALDEIILKCKQGILWIITTLIFTSQELRDEAFRHCYSGVVRIPGVFYGVDFIKGYCAIRQHFPGRCGLVRLDYVLGYVKTLILTSCACGLILLMARLVG